MKVLFSDHNQVLARVIPHFEMTNDLNEAERIVVWSDLTHNERTLVEIGKRRGIPTFVVQHGRRGSSRYFPPFNEPITADKLLVWGYADIEALVTSGHPIDKIKVVGSPILHNLQGRQPHQGVNIVFSPEHWDHDVEENLKIAKELKKLKGVKVITKIIEGHDPKRYQNPIFSDRHSSEHLQICAEVLATADLVVGVSESTFELMAQALDIPVVIVDEWTPKAFGGDDRYKHNYRRIISRGSKKTTLKDLNKTIKQQLANPSELANERTVIVDREAGDYKNAVDNIVHTIHEG